MAPASPPRSALYRRMAVVMHVIIFLYAASFWIQTGVLPFLSKKLGVDTVVFGYLETTFAVAMLLGGPIFGRFGDLFGARAALLVAMTSSFLTYAILSQTNSFLGLLTSRFMAFMMHAMHGAQMVMTDVSDNTDRANAIGRLGVSYGIGMVVGPIIGGYVTTVKSEQFAAGVAAGLCLLTIVVVFIFVPANTKDPQKSTLDSKEKRKNGNVFDFGAILSLLKIPEVFFIVALKTVVGIPAGIFHSMFSMVNMERFQLTPQSNGQLLSYVGVLTMVMQGFGVGFFSKRFSDSILLKVSILVMSLAYLCLSFANTLVLLCVVMIPMVMAGALLNTIASSTITKSVSEADTGTSLGLSMATHSIIRTVSPTIGGYMYSLAGYPSFGLLGFIFNGAMALYLFITNHSALSNS